jgi:hypothetical protein
MLVGPGDTAYAAGIGHFVWARDFFGWPSLRPDE